MAGKWKLRVKRKMTFRVFFDLDPCNFMHRQIRNIRNMRHYIPYMSQIILKLSHLHRSLIFTPIYLTQKEITWHGGWLEKKISQP